MCSGGSPRPQSYPPYQRLEPTVRLHCLGPRYHVVHIHYILGWRKLAELSQPATSHNPHPNMLKWPRNIRELSAPGGGEGVETPQVSSAKPSIAKSEVRARATGPRIFQSKPASSSFTCQMLNAAERQPLAFGYLSICLKAARLLRAL